jgi:tetrahydromethanopterin S-methyltransferase subunit G
MISEIQSDIDQTEAETAIYELANFNIRANAIDFIEFHIIDRIEALIQQAGMNDELFNLKIRANRIKEKLEFIDTEMFRQLKQQISISKDKGFVFRKIIDDFFSSSITNVEHPDVIGYDNLDILINRLLCTGTIPEAKKDLEPEMVFYQKTPARIIFELSKKISREDIFFDIGSGVGQVVILVNLISSAKAIGIEFEPAYCNYAKEVASGLDLVNVLFINENAKDIDYSKGSVFFLYTPFYGQMLKEVLTLLQKHSFKKMIRIFTYGPCSIEIAEQSWLQCINGKADDVYKLYEFNSLLNK